MIWLRFITSFSLERSQEDMLKLIAKESASVKLWLERRYFSSTMLLFMSTFAKDGDALKKLLFKYETKLLHKTFLPGYSKWRLS